MTGDSPEPELDLELPGRAEYVRTARHAIGAFAHLHGLPEEVVEDLKLAVSEACTNALNANAERRGAAGAAEPIRMLARAAPGEVEIEVLDRGPGPHREVQGAPHELDTGSLPFETALSLPLIRGLVDELVIAAREGGGSVVRMRLVAEGRLEA